MKKRPQETSVTHRQFVRLVVTMTCLLVAVIIITCAVYCFIIMRRNQTYVDGTLKQYQDNLTTQMAEYTQLAQTAAYDTSVREYLLEDEPYARYEASLKVSTLFSNLKMVQRGIVDFAVFRPNDSSSTYASFGMNQTTMMQRLWQCTKPEIIGIYRHASSYGQPQSANFVAVVGCPVYSMDLNGTQPKIIGAVAVVISQQEIESNLLEFYQLEGMHYALVDQNRTIILGEELVVSESDWQHAHEAARYSYDTLTDSIVLTQIPEMDAVLIVKTDKLILLKDLFLSTMAVLLMVICLLCAMLYLSGRISREITRPLSDITRAVKQMDADPTHRRAVPNVGNSDFRMLSSSLNKLLKTETRLTNELLEANSNLYKSELAKKHLELEFLRSQINPHFLYNTLETIRGIALVHRMPEIASASKDLAKLLRYSIKGGDVTSIASELEIIQCYLSIQQLRYGARITSVFHVDDDVRDLRIPRMCLQPLVENAIVHGLETSLEPGILTISCHLQDNALHITVQDTGVGICLEELERINSQLSDPFSEDAEQLGGIGMLNVARRLQLSLGSDFSMRVASELTQGTTVFFQMPLDRIEQLGGSVHV